MREEADHPLERMLDLEDVDGHSTRDADDSGSDDGKSKPRRFQIFRPLGYTWLLCGTPHVSVGPHWPMLLYTFTVIILPSIFFFIYVSPDYPVAVQIIGYILFGICASSLALTGCVDPGVIPKGSPQHQAPYFTNQEQCRYCRVYRPPRAAHCHDCGLCMEEMDHHCPWMGKCVAKNNLRAFYSFLVSLTALFLFLIVLTGMHVAK